MATDSEWYACGMTSDPSYAARIRQRSLRIGIRFLVFCVLYVLSIGPMYWYWYEARFIGGNYWIAALYEPLLQACRIEPVGDLVNWYIDLWTA